MPVASAFAFAVPVYARVCFHLLYELIILYRSTLCNGRDSVVTRNKRDFIQIVSVWRWVYIEILAGDAEDFFSSNFKHLSVS